MLSLDGNKLSQFTLYLWVNSKPTNQLIHVVLQSRTNASADTIHYTTKEVATLPKELISPTKYHQQPTCSTRHHSLKD